MTKIEFQVGDVVYDLFYGKGKVVEIDATDKEGFPVYCSFNKEDFRQWYTADGIKSSDIGFEPALRTLFFSPPKVEGLTIRPFKPTLIGKRVILSAKNDKNNTTSIHIIEDEVKESILVESGVNFDKKFWNIHIIERTV